MELIAFIAILVISVGATIAGSKLLLWALLSLMTRHGLRDGFATTPISKELG